MPITSKKLNITFKTLGLVLVANMTLACAAKPTPVCQKHNKQKGAPFNYTICTVTNVTNKPNNQQLAMYWWDDQKKSAFYNFNALKTQLDLQNTTLKFAVNGGMYNHAYAPLALYVENGYTIKDINLKEGAGNFHLMPNGVFWIDDNNIAHVTESQTYQQRQPKAHYATQSGPMLVIDGKIHPKFNKDSTSYKLRNGVGICQSTNTDGKKINTVNFVNSDEWVNFYSFATLFKDKLNCKNALFLDGGRASAIYSTDTKQHDKKQMGVIIGLIQPQPRQQ